MSLNREGETVLNIMHALGFDVGYDELDKFLKGKHNKPKVYKKYVPKTPKIVKESDNKNITESDIQKARETFKKLLSKYGYSFPEEMIDSRLDELNDEATERLVYAMGVVFDNIRVDRYTTEKVFSRIDFFKVKENGDYENIVNSFGETYFRIMPKEVEESIDSVNISYYDKLYKLVTYNGEKYLVTKDFDGKQIIYVPDQVFESEFRSVNSYLETFEYVGKNAYRSKSYEGPNKWYYGEHLSRERCERKKEGFYVLYKNGDMVLGRHFDKKKVYGYWICPGSFYTDDGWEYEDNPNIEDISLEDVVYKLEYGKKTNG